MAASYDSTLRFGAQTPFSDQLIGHLEGGQWQVDANHTSLIAAGNGSEKAAQAALTIFYDQGRKQYRLEQTIAADDQWWVDIGQLIRNRVPDKNGNTLPVDLTSGAYQLREISATRQDVLYEGKVVTDKTFGHATYGCMVCCGYGGDAGAPFLIEDPTGVSIQQSSPVDVYANNACSGTPEYVSGFFNTWGTDNTAIMTAVSASVTGVGVGSAIIRANASYMPSGQGQDQRRACPQAPAQAEGGGQVAPIINSIDPQQVMIGAQSVQITISGSGFGSTPTVNLPSGVTQTSIASTDSRVVVIGNVAFVSPTSSANISVTAQGMTSNQMTITLNGPNHTIVQSDVIGTTTTDPTAQSRFVSYRIYNLDQTPVGLISIAEALSETGYSCQQPNPGNQTSTCNGQYMTDSSGGFTDEWGMYTGFTPAGCGVNIIDHWQWCNAPGANPPAPNPGLTFQTISGFIHTADTQINGYKNPPNPIPQGTTFVP